jgi:hypothetical protein
MFAGLGYNVLKNCCNGCKKKTIKPIEKCECGPKKPQINNELCYAKSFKNHEPKKVCKFIRVHVDIPSIVSKLELNDNEIKYSYLSNFYANVLIFKSLFVYQLFFPPPNNQTPITGREILTLKAVLLI